MHRLYRAEVGTLFQVRADLQIAGASGRLQIIMPSHGRPDINIGLGTGKPQLGNVDKFIDARIRF
jgi:hypothetical protein